MRLYFNGLDAVYVYCTIVDGPLNDSTNFTRWRWVPRILVGNPEFLEFQLAIQMSSFSLRGCIYRESKVLCVIYGGLETQILSVIHHNSQIFCMARNKFYVDIFRSFIRAKLVQLEFKGRN